MCKYIFKTISNCTVRMINFSLDVQMLAMHNIQCLPRPWIKLVSNIYFRSAYIPRLPNSFSLYFSHSITMSSFALFYGWFFFVDKRWIHNGIDKTRRYIIEIFRSNLWRCMVNGISIINCWSAIKSTQYNNSWV